MNDNNTRKQKTQLVYLYGFTVLAAIASLLRNLYKVARLMLIPAWRSWLAWLATYAKYTKHRAGRVYSVEYLCLV